MKTKLTMGVLAIAAITAFSFTKPEQKSVTTYTVNAKTTTAAWLGKKVTGQHNGTIGVTQGTVTAEKGKITGGTVEFNMNSITCEDLKDKEWNDKLVGHLKSEDFFNVAKFPNAKIEITKVTPVAGSKDNDFDVVGKLTIKGITNDISFPAKIKMDDKTMVVIAKVMVNRVKYDIKYGSASIFESIGDKAINDEFELSVNVVAAVK
jgi:polyisoprenoid-binding protein YceI